MVGSIARAPLERVGGGRDVADVAGPAEVPAQAQDVERGGRRGQAGRPDAREIDEHQGVLAGERGERADGPAGPEASDDLPGAVDCRR
jgi:hypothetical protein